MTSKMMFIMIYIAILFIICRIFDLALKTRDLKSLSFIQTNLVVNPVKLSVKHLKKLLDYRGLNYVGNYLMEKQNIKNLDQISDSLNEKEIKNIEEKNKKSKIIDEANLVTTFSSGTHFYELVEDAKDSVWLILVRAKFGSTWFDKILWKNILKMAYEYGIRVGVFDCFQDWQFCENKNWQTTHFLLAMPRNGFKSKEDVLFVTHNLTEKTNVEVIFNWIYQELGSRVKKIKSKQELEKLWFQKSYSNEVKLIYISTLVDVPLLLSTLAIKFSGRIKFGAFKLNAKNGLSKVIKNHENKVPLIVLIFSNGNLYIYNKKNEESFNYYSLELFLKSMRPEMNDIFLISLFLLNSSLGLEIFWIRRNKIWKHLLSWLINFIKANVVFFLIWLFIMTLSSFSIMDQLTYYLLQFCQFSSSTHAASLLRYDVNHYYSPTFLIISYLITGVLLMIFNKFFLNHEIENEDNFLIENNFWESTLLTFFRPIEINLRSISSLFLEDHLELSDAILIERLASPNLWFQPNVISNEYVNQLPIWRYIQEEEEEEDGNVENIQNLIYNRNSQKQLTNTKKIFKKLIYNENEKLCNFTGTSKTNLQSKECAICLDDYKFNDLICGLPCFHNYHQKCIMNWINLNNHCCPKCRWPTYKFK